MQPIKIEHFTIDEKSSPFVIAELSGNHNQSLERALALTEAAAKAGANGLKLQTYTADTMTIDCDKDDFVVSGTGAAWQSRKLYDLYHEAHTPWAWHEPIFNRARELGMVPFSTPFDESSVDFLETLGTAVYKIASFELTDNTLLKKVISTGKPLIISTGMASEEEIAQAVKVLHKYNCRKFVLLKCTSAYPAKLEDANLQTIPYLSEKYRCYAGLSDHTMEAVAPIVATSLGAKVIEKHITLKREEGGVDSHFSLEPSEFKQMTMFVAQAHTTIGKIQKAPSETELACRQYRRSLYIVKDMQVGDYLTKENVRAIRPGKGLSPLYLEEIIGCRVNQPLERGTAMSLDYVDKPNS